MNKRFAEATFGLGAVTALTLTGCTSTAPTATPETSASQSAQAGFTPKMQHLAATALQVTDKYPGKTEGKPPRSVGVTIPLADGGELSVAVQTASNGTPDPTRPQEIGVTQMGTGDRTFSATFLELPGDVWNMSCTDHNGLITAETHERTVQLGSGAPGANPELAKTLLSHVVEDVQHVLDTAASRDAHVPLQPLGDICEIVR